MMKQAYIYIVVAVASLLGVLAGGAIVYIAFQENSQGEFFDTQTGAIDWPYTLMHFAMGFFFVFGLIVFVGIVVHLAAALFQGKKTTS